MDFRNESVADLAQQVRARKIGARELTEAALARIDALDGDINAFVALDPEAALAEASSVDERIAQGDPVGPLAGIPIGVKDLEDARGFVTTHGSSVDAGNAPAAADSPHVARLRSAGCIVLGKTNTPEFGHMADTDNPVFGRTYNPWSLVRSAGGSSGGAAAAVAAGMVPMATGSDGGGSIRIPAAVCGLSGMKASLGRVPMGGPSPTHWGNLSVRGPMTRRVRDAALALDAVVGPDPTDQRSLPAPADAWYPQLEHPGLPARVGWSPTLGYAPIDDEVLAVCEQAVKTIASTGVDVVLVDEVWSEDPIRVWYTISAAHNLRALGEYEGTDIWSEFDPLLRASVEWARGAVSVTDFLRAEDEIHGLYGRLGQVFEDVDLLLTPTTAGQTPRAGAPGTINGEEDLNWVKMTYGFNLTRSPAGSLCAGFTSDGMPVGLQVVGPQHDDLGVLRAMAAFEDALAIDRVAPFGLES